MSDKSLPQNLCYVMYTSGTTGQPKGVAVEHGAAANLLRSMGQAPGLTAADALLAVTPLTFDIAGLEIFLPLITGARLVLAPEKTSADGASLRAHLATEGVSAMQATPSTWRLLLDAGWRDSSTFRVLCGGEALPRELARDLIDAGADLWNCYGPTETTIWSTLEHAGAQPESITIGRPIANTTTYILDDALEPVPVGVVGNLFIGGAGLARGYLERPAESAASYLPDPFDARPGARMYSTGDQARYLPDGRIEWRGRRDQQVKLRGFRIELEAISSVLDAHPLVQESVVVVQEDAFRGPYLAAYVVGKPAGNIAQVGLRAELKRRLPSYMVPAAIVPVEALPRTPHGKIDRRALPAPTESSFPGAGELAPPRTPVEEALAGIWRDVLGLSAVGVEDNFFELGGNSLQAARVIFKIREALGADISVRTFFEAPTIADLARQAGQVVATVPAPQGFLVQRVSRAEGLLLAPQQENWWWQEQRTGNIHPNNVYYSIGFEGRLDAMALEQSLAMLHRRHEALRTAFLPCAGGGAVPVVSPPETSRFLLTTIDLSRLPAEPRNQALIRVVRSGNSRPFDLAHSPLCRVLVVRLGAGEHVVVFSTHHLVCDGWSIEVLASELSQLYAAFVNGAPAVLPELSFQYVDFARWQRDWLVSPDFAPQLAYWMRQLRPPWPELFPAAAGIAAELDLPYLIVRRRAAFVISAETAAAARSLARANGCTLFSVVVAALKLALYAHTRQPDVRIGTLAANRAIPGSEKVVGLFANVVCLRTDVPASPTFRDLVKAVQNIVLDATAHQELPFDVLRQALHMALGPQPGSLIQVMAFWAPMPQGTLQFSGARASLALPPAEDAMALGRGSLELVINFEETPAELNGAISWKTGRFSQPQIERFAHDLELCLRLAGQQPALGVEQLCDTLNPGGADLLSE